MSEQLMKFAESIPMEDLFEEIRRVTNLHDLKFTYKIEDRGSWVLIRFSSDELVEKVGFLRLMFASIRIEQFNSNIQMTKDDEELIYWGSASFRYDHPGGGSNGCEFLNFRYPEKTKTWEFWLEGAHR